MLKRLAPALAIAAASLAACGDGRSITAAEDVNQAYDGVPGDPTLTALEDVQSPQSTLRQAEVRDRLGERIGVVEDVELMADGTLEAVVIALDGGGAVAATPLQARFDDEADEVAVTVYLEELERRG